MTIDTDTHFDWNTQLMNGLDFSWLFPSMLNIFNFFLNALSAIQVKLKVVPDPSLWSLGWAKQPQISYCDQVGHPEFFRNSSSVTKGKEGQRREEVDGAFIPGNTTLLNYWNKGEQAIAGNSQDRCNISQRLSYPVWMMPLLEDQINAGCGKRCGKPLYFQPSGRNVWPFFLDGHLAVNSKGEYYLEEAV